MKILTYWVKRVKKWAMSKEKIVINHYLLTHTVALLVLYPFLQQQCSKCTSDPVQFFMHTITLLHSESALRIRTQNLHSLAKWRQKSEFPEEMPTQRKLMWEETFPVNGSPNQKVKSDFSFLDIIFFTCVLNGKSFLNLVSFYGCSTKKCQKISVWRSF